jgi:hypothetical protein
MNPRFRRTLTGVGLALSLTLLAAPVAQATPAARGNAVRTVSGVQGFLHAIWSFLAGDDPYGPHTKQGPTVDPNGYTVH